MLWTYFAAALCFLTQIAIAEAIAHCRCHPDDPCWPSADAWDAFNATVDGRLIKTLPLGHVCHHPTYNEEACLDLRRRWTAPETHYDSSHSIMVPVFANSSCNPWTGREESCTVGVYVQYAVNVSRPEHVTRTINFVRKHNIRLVTRNTGYLGKSSGAYSLALWTHHLTSLDILTWSDKTYHGPAVKLSAGVQGSDLLAFAAQHNLTALTGNCPSVGVAGGYIQGGGHSALSSKYGLAADQLLEMEIVNAAGRFETVNRQSHADLFWALSGGGAGTFAVVWSVTVRAYPDLPSAAVTLEFDADSVSEGRFLEGVKAFQRMLPAIHDAGCATIFSFSRRRFNPSLLMCHGKSSTEALELLYPLMAELSALHIPHRHTTIDHARWSDGAREGWLGEAQQYRVNNIQAATWLIPRSAVLDPARNVETVNSILRMQDLGAIVGMQSFSPSRDVAVATDNAVFPGWRDAVMLVWVILPTNDSTPMATLLEDQNRLSEVLMPVIQAVAPDGGAYLNEADAVDAEWKRNNHGAHYERLLAIKHKYDPEGLFYARHAVGSDAWVEHDDGRLCRATKEVSQDIDEL